MGQPSILVIDGNRAATREQQVTAGGQPSGEGYAQVLKSLAGVSCDIVRPADGEVRFASGSGLASYDGVAITGSALNSTASLGTTRGTAATLSQSELDAMRARLASLWNVQPGVEHPEELFVTIRIRLNPDRRLAGPPQIISTGSSPRYQAAAEAAVRAVLQGQPYTMLRDETYDQWKYMDIDFDPKQMFHS